MADDKAAGGEAGGGAGDGAGGGAPAVSPVARDQGERKTADARATEEVEAEMDAAGEAVLRGDGGGGEDVDETERKKKAEQSAAVAEMTKGNYDSDDDDVFGADDDDEEEEAELDDDAGAKSKGGNKSPTKAAEEKTEKPSLVNTLLDSDSDSDSDNGKGSGAPAAAKKQPSSPSGEEAVVMDDMGNYVRAREAIKFPDALEIPRTRFLKSGEELRVTRLPNILHLEPRCYDGSLYSEEAEAKRLRNIGKEFVGENVIRWRYKKTKDGKDVVDADGNKEVESNARFVQWSDGSMQLLIGDEVFNVNANDTRNNFAFSMTNDHALKRRCLEGLGSIKQSLQFRPTSLTSAAHREMELKVKSRMVKTGKLKRLVMMSDPDAEQQERARQTEARLRLQQRQRSKRANQRKGPEWNANFLEQDDYRRGTSIKRTKQMVFGDEDISSDDEPERPRKGKARNRAFSSSSEEEFDGGSSSSSSDEGAASPSKKKAEKKQPVSKPGDSDEDSDEDESASPRKRKASDAESSKQGEAAAAATAVTPAAGHVVVRADGGDAAEEEEAGAVAPSAKKRQKVMDDSDSD